MFDIFTNDEQLIEVNEGLALDAATHVGLQPEVTTKLGKGPGHDLSEELGTFIHNLPIGALLSAFDVVNSR